MNEFETRVQDVFREVFDDQKLTIYREMQAKDVEGSGRRLQFTSP